MRYAVIGSAGQLGRDLVPRLDGEVIPLTREQADLTDVDQLSATLTDLRPDVVINCAAYNFVDKAETEPEAAFAVNAWGIRSLARICRDVDCLLVHYSTDYVYGLGDGDVPLREQDAPGPVSVYGMSKLTGEYVVRQVNPRHLLVRTCGLYGVWGSGGKGGNFVETMLRVAGQGRPLRVVADQRCTPTYTADLAAATVALLRKGCEGLFHVTNGGACSWYEFAAAIFEQAGVKADLTPISSNEFNAPAQRPRYSVLAAEGLIAAGIGQLRLWHEALGAYLEERGKRQA
jgi:dTDP-4-dehydrorhamnose reductase